MKIKQKPEDFSVKESYRFDEVVSGQYRVYLMDKQKLSTFDAIDRIRERFGLRPGSISYCGLKDKQGRTEQLIAVDGYDVDLQEPDLRLKFLGHTDKPLTAANTTSNRFSVTVRSLTAGDLGQLNLSSAEVSRLGVVNYFDSQRFGSLKHGQGFIAKDLIRGDFEAALKNYLAKPSPLDRSEDGKVKEFWKENWGHWNRRVPYAAGKKYDRVLRSLKEKPTDFVRAFLQVDASYRALLLFTYQSYLWNEGVRRYLQLTLKPSQLFPLPYQAGTILFHKDAEADVLRTMRERTFPLLAPDSTFTDPQVEEAVRWVLSREKLKLEDLRIAESPRLLFFKHEERPLLIYPHKLVLGRPQADELNPGFQKTNVAFTLPPGSYATLVVKRLFHFSYRDDTPDEIRQSQANFGQLREARRQREEELEEREEGEARSAGRPPVSTGRRTGSAGRGAESAARWAPGVERKVESAGRKAAGAKRPAALIQAAPAVEAAPPEKAGAHGFRAHQKAKKEAKTAAQAVTRTVVAQKKSAQAATKSALAQRKSAKKR